MTVLMESSVVRDWDLYIAFRARSSTPPMKSARATGTVDLWGRDVADLFLPYRRLLRRIASCLHADTMEELHRLSLVTPPFGFSAENFRRLGLIPFVHVAHLNFASRDACVLLTLGGRRPS